MPPATDAASGPAPSPDGGGWRGRAWVGPVVLSAVVAIVAGAGIGFFALDDRPRAEVGQVIEQVGNRVVQGRSASVMVPFARLTITVGDQVSEIPTGSEASFGVRAPRGGGFVGISMMVNGAPSAMPKTSWGQALVPEIVLLDGDRRYPVHGFG